MSKLNSGKQRYFIVGGAGFIGSHVVRRVINNADLVTVFDNFTSGKEWHLGENLNNPKLKIVKGDVKDLDHLAETMQGHDIVFHFASNPDISKAATQPDIDFWEGTYLTQNVLEAMRITNVKKLIYASGSGVYGDVGEVPVCEDQTPMLPVSTYGASKLAGEALISAYSYMFEISAVACRFANVVGPHQTHGVGYDFVRYLTQNPKQLKILGNGTQSKSYIYVDDVVSALLLVADHQKTGFDFFNVATQDYLNVREIADLVVQRMGLNNVQYIFSGGDRGWKGDVPIVRFDSSKIRALGWRNEKSTREALISSVDSIILDVKNGKIS